MFLHGLKTSFSLWGISLQAGNIISIEHFVIRDIWSSVLQGIVLLTNDHVDITLWTPDDNVFRLNKHRSISLAFM